MQNPQLLTILDRRLDLSLEDCVGENLCRINLQPGLFGTVHQLSASKLLWIDELLPKLNGFGGGKEEGLSKFDRLLLGFLH